MSQWPTKGRNQEIGVYPGLKCRSINKKCSGGMKTKMEFFSTGDCSSGLKCRSINKKWSVGILRQMRSSFLLETGRLVQELTIFTVDMQMSQWPTMGSNQERGLSPGLKCRSINKKCSGGMKTKEEFFPTGDWSSGTGIDFLYCGYANVPMADEWKQSGKRTLPWLKVSVDQ